MENAIIVGVLLAVVGVGLFGLYYANNVGDSGTMFVPVMTGMAAYRQSEANITIGATVGISLSGGDCAGIYGPTVDVTPPGSGLINFDTFGNCAGCSVYGVTQAPCDAAYGGNASLGNVNLLAIIETDSNTYINVSSKLNASLPTGFTSSHFTIAPFNTNTTTTGTVESCRDNNVDGSFDAGSPCTWSTAYTQFAGNWSDGTGSAGSPKEKYSVATRWIIDDIQLVPDGLYTIKYDFLAEKTVQ